ncbi:DNA polymerase epsilon subunit 3 [Trichinella nativa]|uniref:DNA polymerase epsilon subunit 3 n=1 Tax=Trichinella nativa TaxID=6335 RepID=A0A0V1KW41_9BILA|nr:DNA polymerase epsilon subunit 3 [Trichinella nativa]
MAERMEDLNIPLSAINRILNLSSLAGNPFNKECRTAISRATSIFMLYLTSIAHGHAVKQKRKTINVADVLQAAKEAELDAQGLRNIAEMMNNRKHRTDGPPINGGSSLAESMGSSELTKNRLLTVMLCSNIFFNMRLLSSINLFTYFFFLFIASVQVAYRLSFTL